MKQFSEATGYPYEFVRALAKQHRSWKSIVQHVKEKGCINPLLGFNGFITFTENFKFHGDHQSVIRRIVTDDVYNTFSNSFRDRHIEMRDMFTPSNISRMNNEDSASSLLNQHSTRYSEWYTRPIWLILKDIGSKLDTILRN